MEPRYILTYEDLFLGNVDYPETVFIAYDYFSSVTVLETEQDAITARENLIKDMSYFHRATKDFADEKYKDGKIKIFKVEFNEVLIS